jgi:hypothetical protein
MPETCLVIGRVIPERKGFRHEGLRLDVKDPKIGVDACVIFLVQDGQLTARIVGEIGHVSNYAVRNMVKQAEQTWLDAHAFIHGETFEVDIVGIVKDAEDRSDGSADFYYQDNVNDIIRARECQLGAQDIWKLRGSVYLRRTLHDLRMALTYHDDGPFYCYRAVETIRHDIGEGSWDRMWDVLGGSRDEVDVFRELARSMRHGEPAVYPAAEWRKAITSTWNIVERYMLHLLHGG